MKTKNISVTYGDVQVRLEEKEVWLEFKNANPILVSIEEYNDLVGAANMMSVGVNHQNAQQGY